MERLLDLLRRAVARLVDDPPRHWSPTALDPYGILPIMDALRAQQDARDAEVVAIEAEPRDLRATG